MTNEKNKNIDDAVTVGYKTYKYPKWKGYSSISKEHVNVTVKLYSNEESLARSLIEESMKSEYLMDMLLWVQARLIKHQDEEQPLGICLNSAMEIFEKLMLSPCEVENDKKES